MGHVINPISLRAGYTVAPTSVWHSYTAPLYSSVFFRTKLITDYIKKLFVHPSLRYLWLLSNVRVVYTSGCCYVVAFLYSQRVLSPLISLYEKLFDSKISSKKKKRFKRTSNKKLGWKPTFIRSQHSRNYYRSKPMSTLPKKRAILEWLLFAIVKNYYLRSSFTILKKLVEKDLFFLFKIKAYSLFSFIPQELLSANAWVSFIKNKLKRNTHFSAIMHKVTPVLNQFLYNDKTLIGYKIVCSGRTSRRGRASVSLRSRGNIPLSSVISFISYSFDTVILKNSICGIKVWLFFKQRPKIFSSIYVTFV